MANWHSALNSFLYALFIVIATSTFVIGEAQHSSTSSSSALGKGTVLTLREAVDRALRNNPRIRIIGKDVETEMYNLRAAKAERMPKIDLTSGITQYRYPMPLTPIVLESLSNVQIPKFEQTIYDAGAVLRLPLYRGGRLQRNVAIAELRKAIAEDNLQFGREDLIYNVTSVYHKALQLEQLKATSSATVKQLEAHRRDVETLYRAGSVPYLDLVKTDVELGHAVQNRLEAENNLESGYELLRTLIGLEDVNWRPALSPAVPEDPLCSTVSECREAAQNKRSDLKAMRKRIRAGEEKIRVAQGRRYPDVSLIGEYFDRSGTDLDYKENWDVGVRMTIPLFDGGAISAEVAREKNELAKLREEERGLNLAIEKEVKDAFLALENARSRITVAEAALGSAKESLRVEDLKYRAGAATNTDVIDAQTALQRAETDLAQARFDRGTAVAALKRAVGGTR